MPSCDYSAFDDMLKEMRENVWKDIEADIMSNLFNSYTIPGMFVSTNSSDFTMTLPGDGHTQPKEFHCAECGCKYGNTAEEIEDEDYYVTNKYSCHACGETWNETIFVDEEYYNEEDDCEEATGTDQAQQLQPG